MKIKARGWVIFFICVLLLAGCAGLSEKESQTKTAALIEPQTITKLNDVPVPVGFKLIAESSYFFETQGIRIGLLKYEGKNDPDVVVNFYKEQMPMYNWRLLNLVEYGERLMNFDREQESCIISLLPRGKKIAITISVGPKAQVATKKVVK
jgi:hypothetical protein